MARSPRIVVPGIPLHIIQRGNNRLPVFFAEEDYLYYLNTLTEVSLGYGCKVHAYVLMTNHVHLLITPEEGESAWNNRGQTTFYSSRARLLGYAGPEGGTLVEEFVVVHVVRSVAGKGQAHHAVDNIDGGRAYIDGHIHFAQSLQGVQNPGDIKIKGVGVI